MNRRESREQAFIFLFESTFGTRTAEDIIKYAEIAREEILNDFARQIFEGTIQNQTEIDAIIEKNATGWSLNRLSRTTVSILRLAIFEMLFQKITPISVIINEALEIAKKYSTREEAAYINGILGTIDKTSGE